MPTIVTRAELTAACGDLYPLIADQVIYGNAIIDEDHFDLDIVLAQIQERRDALASVPIRIANARRLADEVAAEVFRPPTPEQMDRQIADLQIDLREALECLWRHGGEEGRDWIRAHHPITAARLTEEDGGAPRK